MDTNFRLLHRQNTICLAKIYVWSNISVRVIIMGIIDRIYKLVKTFIKHQFICKACRGGLFLTSLTARHLKETPVLLYVYYYYTAVVTPSAPF